MCDMYVHTKGGVCVCVCVRALCIGLKYSSFCRPIKTLPSNKNVEPLSKPECMFLF